MALLEFAGAARAFRHRNYRYYFAGQIITNIGIWIQNVARAWLVYRLTGSPALLGITAFASQVPFLVLAPLAGVIADHYDRRTIMMFTQAISLGLAALLAFLTFQKLITPWEIVALSAASGIVSAFDIPTRQAFLRDIVGLEDLPNAVALNSTWITGAQLIGPAIGGVMIAALGEAWCFTVTAGSYLAVIYCLAVINTPRRTERRERLSLFTTLNDGIRYIRDTPLVMSLMAASAIIGFLGMPYNSLLPIFASEVVGGGAKTLGSMMSSVGLGALVGAVFLTARFDTDALNRLFAISVIGFGALLILFSYCHLLWLSLGFLLLIGFAQMVRSTAGLTVVQTAIPDALRGRVLATNSMLSTGLPPFGSLIGGIAASHFGASVTVAIGGVACLLCGIFFYRQLHQNRLRGALSAQEL